MINKKYLVIIKSSELRISTFEIKKVDLSKGETASDLKDYM